MDERKDDVCESADMEQLSQEFDQFKLEKETVEAQIRKLRSEEDFEKGVFFAQDIHRLQQDKLRLDTEMEIRKRRMNRLRMAVAENGVLH
ncbi:hypothetical protein JCM16814_26640 [Desulfobaculum senezii]|jgi:hypothetical protein|uniref:hypothetical protein n=1 Tax=Desulfobaculum sp. SPO524 TaxID=3378071 RepID=UPI003851DFA8